MKQPVTTILLAPSGAGKTTRVEALQNKGHEFVHINRDAITFEYLHRNGINGRLVQTAESRERIDALLVQGEQEYYRRLQTEFGKKTPHVVIDYPPGGTGEWIGKTIELSKGRKVIIEGISIDPRLVLPRVLERSSTNIDDIRTLELMNPDRVFFANWLKTFQKFPGSFSSAVAGAHEAYLYDYNTSAMNQPPKLAARWSNGVPHIIDKKAHAAFMRLEKLDPETAWFDAESKGMYEKDGKTFHTFSVRTNGFYGSEAKRKSLEPKKVEQVVQPSA